MLYEYIKPLHSYLAYGVLLTVILAIIIGIQGWFSKREFLPSDRSIALLALILTHTMFVLGIILWVVSPNGFGKVDPNWIKNSALRLTVLEHPLTNLIAIVLITIGWSKHKREESGSGKFKKISIFYTLGLLLLLSRIPWGNWLS